MSLNNLAIILAKNIEKEILHLCIEQNTLYEKADKIIARTPNFYMLREKIAKCLLENMDTLTITTKESPELFSELGKEYYEEFIHHSMKKSAAVLVEKILDSDDHFEKFVFEYGSLGYYKELTRSIIVVKTGKIAKEARECK